MENRSIEEISLEKLVNILLKKKFPNIIDRVNVSTFDYGKYNLLVYFIKDSEIFHDIDLSELKKYDDNTVLVWEIINYFDRRKDEKMMIKYKDLLTDITFYIHQIFRIKRDRVVNMLFLLEL
jgi:hypothetical protein